ncbi:chorismate mutase [Eubacterium sp. AB3007]|uniref:chorismate mutase n=1 Tax=Eubacterium sp. AB3007 TaxID=1392487 RepID=UPI0005542C89|nr:chorismate mutase [Eubacterium sp. AB3007]
MELKDYRAEIDRIDREIVSLFQQRMRTCEGIARYKQANNLPVMDTGRELEKIDQVRGLVDKDMEKYIELLYNVIMKMSRAHQKEIV